jgi:signal transduction histidine kinase/GAF domain-containing protein
MLANTGSGATRREVGELAAQPEGLAERLARLYLILSRTNQAIGRAADATEMLTAVCRIIVEAGGFRMSWVGMIDQKAGNVVPAASAGHDEGYLDFVQVRLAGARSEGPTGQAIRLGRTVVCEDIATDPRMEPWRQEALRRGYRSSIGLPLVRSGKLVGVLTVYADLPERFDAGEVELLEELARDVAFGLSSIEEGVERRRAQEALVASDLRFRGVAETLLDPLTIIRAVRDDKGAIVDYVYEFANAAACAAHRVFCPEDLVGRSVGEHLTNARSSGLFEMYARAIETGEPILLDDFSYSDRWGGEAMDRVFDMRGRAIGDSIVFSWRDVTERRRMERRRAEELEAAVQERTVQLEVARERATELARLSSAMLEVEDRRRACEILLQAARKVSGALDGMVALVEPGTERMTMIESIGADPEQLARVAGSPSTLRTPIRDAVASGQPVVVVGAAEFEAAYPALAAAMSPRVDRTRVAVPLRSGDRIVGAIALGLPPRPIEPDEMAFFVAAANAAAHMLERLRLADAEREARVVLDAVVAQMPVGVTIAGPEGVRFSNAAFDRIVGASGGETGRAPRSWHGSTAGGRPLTAPEWPLARSLAGGEMVLDEEIEIARDDGTATSVTQTSAPVRDPHGEIVAAVAVTVDVSERKRSEQFRDAFLAVLSHELRTPVTTIYGAGQLLGSDRSIDDATRVDLASDVVAEASRLGRMVDDLLVLARAERGVDLTVRSAALIQHRLRAVVRSLEPLWPDRRFVVELPTDLPPVIGDEDYLEHVLRNLLGNAAKYGRSEVRARVRALADSVVITVGDDGPGIDPGDLDRIFELFMRGEKTRQLPGAGIGLFVARCLVEAMNGRIVAANAPGGGAEFTVTLTRYVEGADRP